jgi:hypothetical protein
MRNQQAGVPQSARSSLSINTFLQLGLYEIGGLGQEEKTYFRSRERFFVCELNSCKAYTVSPVNSDNLQRLQHLAPSYTCAGYEISLGSFSRSRTLGCT